MEVDRAAGLVFGGFAVGDADTVGESPVAGELVEVAFDGLFGAAPQFAGVVVPHHGGGVVVAVRADRLPKPGIIAAVAGEAGQLAAVRAGLGVAAGVAGLRFAGAVGFAGAGVPPHGPGVDGAEGRGGEGREHGRVSRDVFGNAFAADQPGAEELEGVTAVDLGAGRAGGGATVAAGFVDHAVRQGRGGGGGEDFAGGGVDAVDLAAEADGVGASGGGPDVIKAARRAARAADSARSPLLPLALPQRRRKTPVVWREYPSNRGAALAEHSVHRPGGGQLSRSWQLSGAGVLPISVLSGPGRTCQGRL